MNRSLRAGGDTLAASYAFGAVGMKRRVNTHIARSEACFAVGAFFTVRFQLQERYFIERGVKRAERADVLH